MATGKKADLEELKSKLRIAGYDREFFSLSMSKDMPEGMGSFDSLFAADSPLLLAAAHSLGALDPSDSKDAAIVQAFEIAGLDHKNPFHWHDVMSVLCVHHFGKRKTKPTTWNAEAILKCYADCEEVKAKHPALKTATDIAKHLRRHNRRYAKYKADKGVRQITKLIEAAYNPKKNLRVRYPEMSDLHLMQLRQLHEDDGIAWTPDLEEKLGDVVSLAKSQHEIDVRRECLRMFRDPKMSGQLLKNARRAYEEKGIAWTPAVEKALLDKIIGRLESGPPLLIP